MEVREARPAEADAVYEVHRRAIEAMGPAAYGDQQVRAWAAGGDPDDYPLDDDDHLFVVARREGGVVGFGDLYRRPPDDYASDADAEVRAVYVAPAHVREGVGSALLSALEDRARAEGCGTIGLSASLNAVEFYGQHGYERVREYPHGFSAGGEETVEGTVVEMRKRL